MADDTMITPVKTETLPPVATVFPEIEVQQKTREPNKFLKVLGGIAGGALNFVAPGLGGILGNVIGGGSGSSFGSYTALMEQQRQFEEMQRYNQISSSLQQRQQNQMLNQQQQNSMQLISVQHRVGMQAQEFTTVSNLLKTRHDSEMSAVNNIKS
jgi:outer membrane lipoprotein SlyB